MIDKRTPTKRESDSSSLEKSPVSGHRTTPKTPSSASQSVTPLERQQLAMIMHVSNDQQNGGLHVLEKGVWKLFQSDIVGVRKLFTTDNAGVKKLFHTDNVFLFVPNIIDYLRLVMIVLFSYHAWLGDYKVAAVCYVINFALDEVDGNSARYFGQTSVYGMLLDILLDETSVLCLGMTLSTLYPKYTCLFQLWSAVDFTAQWANYHFSAMYKNNNFTSTDDWLIKTYFNKYVLSLLWVYGNHIFLLMLYVCFYTTGPQVWLLGWSVGMFKLAACLAAPWSISRLLIMAYLLVTSMRNLGHQDRIARIASRKSC